MQTTIYWPFTPGKNRLTIDHVHAFSTIKTTVFTIVQSLNMCVQPILCVNQDYIVRNGQIGIITGPEYKEYCFNGYYNSRLILVTKSRGLSKPIN